MAERSTRLRGSQFKDATLKPADLQATNSPANGQAAVYDSGTQNFTWQDITVGLFEIDIEGSLIPILGSNADNQFELDGSNDIQPKAI